MKQKAPVVKKRLESFYPSTTIEGFPQFPKHISQYINISDVHVPNNIYRHEEYRTVFDTLYQQLRDDPAIQSGTSILFLSGDISDKPNVNSETMILISDFLIRVSEIIPTVLIVGNHDWSINQRERIDVLLGALFQGTLTKEVQDEIDQCGYLPQKYCRAPRLVFIRKTGVYRLFPDSNYILSVTSFLDGNKVLNADRIKRENGEYLIALAHLTLYGSVTANTVMKQTKYKIADFKGIDWGAIGDIHKFQSLGERQQLCYPGSLLQQNFGESPVDHGYIRRHLPSGELKFIPVYNPWGMLKLEMNKGVTSGLENLKGLKYVKIRVYYDRATTLEQIEEVLESIRAKGIVINYVKKFPVNLRETALKELGRPKPDDELVVKIIDENENSMLVAGVSGGEMEKRREHLDLYNSEVQSLLLKKWLGSRLEDKKAVTKILEWHAEKFRLSRTEENAQAATSSLEWQIDYLKFENVFCYKGTSMIDFSRLKGLVGILGLNGIGKSGLIDLILFMLFDKCDRVGVNNRIDLLNKSSKSGWAELQITDTSSGRQYLFYLNLMRGGTNRKKITCRRLYYKREKTQDDWVLIGSNVETKAISKLLGDYETFVSVYVKLQSNVGEIGATSGPQQHNLLHRLLKLDCFQEVNGLVSEEISLMRREIRQLRGRIESVGEATAKNDENAVRNAVGILEEGISTEEKKLADEIARLKDLVVDRQVVLDQKRVEIELLYQKWGSQVAYWKELKQLEGRLSSEITATDVSKLKKKKLSVESAMWNGERLVKERKQLAGLEWNEQDLVGKIKELRGELRDEVVVEDMNTVTPSLSPTKLVGDNKRDTVFGGDLVTEVTWEQFQKIKLEFNAQKKQVETSWKFNQDCQSCQYNQDLIGWAPGLEGHYGLLVRSLLRRLEGELKDVRERIETLRKEVELQREYPLKVERWTQRLGWWYRMTELRELLIGSDDDNGSIDREKAELKRLEAERNGWEGQIRNLGESLVVARERRLERKRETERLFELQGELELWLLYSEAIGTKGLLKDLVAEKIDFITSLVNGIVQSLVENYSVVIEYTPKGFEVFLKKNDENNNFPTSLRSGEIKSNSSSSQFYNYRVLGGFERFLVNLSLKLALSTISGVSRPNFLVIDEGFGSADVINRGNLGMFLENLEHLYGLVLVVSHLPELGEILEDRRLVIEEEGGGSYVNNTELDRSKIMASKVVRDALDSKRFDVSEDVVVKKTVTKVVHSKKKKNIIKIL